MASCCSPLSVISWHRFSSFRFLSPCIFPIITVFGTRNALRKLLDLSWIVLILLPFTSCFLNLYLWSIRFQAISFNCFQCRYIVLLFARRLQFNIFHHPPADLSFFRPFCSISIGCCPLPSVAFPLKIFLKFSSNQILTNFKLDSRRWRRCVRFLCSLLPVFCHKVLNLFQVSLPFFLLFLSWFLHAAFYLPNIRRSCIVSFIQMYFHFATL